MIIVKLGASDSLEVFQHDDYRGSKEEFSHSSNLVGYWDNQISSVKAIKGNWELYEDLDYSGDHILVCEGEELSGLPDSPSEWNDRVSSVKFTEICGRIFY